MGFEELVTVGVVGVKAILTVRLCTITVAGLLFSDSLTSQSGLKSGHLSPVNERGAVRISVNMSMREKYLNISSSFSISVIELIYLRSKTVKEWCVEIYNNFIFYASKMHHIIKIIANSTQHTVITCILCSKNN